MSGPTFTYMPAPHERGYYGALFQAADTERTGSIGGAKAVEFFRRSNVPIQILRQIWTIADQPPSNSLDPRKFAVAVRLIQLEQNGIQPNSSQPDLAQVGGPNLRPAFFEGIAVPPAAPGPIPQQQQPNPPRPSMGPMGGGGGASATGSFTAGGGPPHPPPSHLQQQLVVQDPYTLTPQEQARYEQIFPEYCKQDPNYMFGAEAVALFSKSGLDQQQLSRIWAMADDPVDNKLDRLEFAIAMHLIVCVSKKNLPLPPVLPMSLKQLKAQHDSREQGPSPPGPPMIHRRVETQDGSVMSGGAGSSVMMGGPSVGGGGGGGPPPPVQVGRGMNGGAMASFQGFPPPQAMMNQPMSSQRNMMQAPPSPVQQNMMQAPPSPQQYVMQAPSSPQQFSMQSSSMPPSIAGGIPSPGRFAGGPRPPVATGMSSGSMNYSGMPGPPPISQGGGASISDAFEGLVGGDTGSISSYRATTPYEQTQQQMYQHNNNENNDNTSSLKDAPEPAPASSGVNDASAPKTTKQLAASYNMGEAHEELEKLKAVLQKLQAENISLKARMGTMTEEEKDVQRELSATVSEVSTLSNELTTLRAQVLASKSRLLEASAELKATKEKKGVIKDLMTEVNATKQAIDEAYEGLESANEAAHATPPPVSNNTDFFGGWGNDVPPPAPLPAPTQSTAPPQPQISKSESTDYSDQKQNFSYMQAPAPAGPGMFDGGGYEPSHERNVSNMSGFGEVMGTGPDLGSISLPPVGESMSYGGTEISNSLSLAEVEVLKTKSKEADDLARDAGESLRQLTAQLDEMRRLADEAEAKARDAAAKPVKKKGLLKRGGAQQKKDAKEIEVLAMDAREKKEKMMQVQAQVKDAEGLAAATKKEAERLNKEAEDAQMQAAAAASMQQHQHQLKQSAPLAQPPSMQQPSTNGYAHSAMPSYGMPHPSQDGGFGGPLGDGYGSSVMTSGGMSIPTPANADDPYSNPFGD